MALWDLGRFFLPVFNGFRRWTAHGRESRAVIVTGAETDRFPPRFWQVLAGSGGANGWASCGHVALKHDTGIDSTVCGDF